MVRYVKPPPEGVECPAQPHNRSGSCQPRDNIGVSCTIQGNSAIDEASKGSRRPFIVPRDNIGISCLPTPEPASLREIPEVSEYESSEENYAEGEFSAQDLTCILGCDRTRLPTTRITSSARGSAAKEELQTISTVRLRAGEDHEGAPIPKIVTNVDTIGSLKYERATPYRPKDNISLFGQHVHYSDEPEKKLPETRKSQLNTSLEVGISNIRKPKHDPRKPRKPIVPKDNIGFSACPLQKPVNRLTTSKMLSTANVKKRSSPPKRKKSLTDPSTCLKERRAATKTKSLKAASKLTILFLYIHFLLSFYLSVAKSQRFKKLFKCCNVRDIYE